MDNHSDISEFLISRRARLTPLQAGLPDFGGRRRVAGLRREEVALLAGMSTEYYTRIERGNAAGVSEAIVEGISRALKLDPAEHSHLHDLVRNANAGILSTRRQPKARGENLRSALAQTIDAMESVPVVVQNRRLDLIAANTLGRALFSVQFEMPGTPVNAARFVFLEPKAQAFFDDWSSTARQTVASLRTEAGRAPFDRALTDLIGELSTRSDHFRALWASHDVRQHASGTKRLHHPVAGELDLTYEVMDVSRDAGLVLVVYTAAPASPSHDGLSLLASWSARSQVSDQGARLSQADSDQRD